MPKLVIDGREIRVPEGTKVIEAADLLGITIPRLCYHPALGPAGSCRLCAVSFLEGPLKGVLMSCSVDARDGMVISTHHPEAVEFRRQVMEWLMMNHPLDCPVCDEGGHCMLQEMTVAGGHHHRRFRGSKRTYLEQDLGPFVQQEMNRCIHCFRCRRFYQDFAGYRDFGALGLGERTYFGRAHEGRLESPFSGNLIDVCPTGALTDKPSRFKARRWEAQNAPSVCIHCSIGCSTTVWARFREVFRIEARHNPEVNGYFICDRGRYGFDYTNHPHRPHAPMIKGKETSPEEAIRVTAEALARILKDYGPQAIGVVGSHRCSLETMAALSILCVTQGWQGPIFFENNEEALKTRLFLDRRVRERILGLKGLERSDAVVAVGVDPLREAPMLALAMRQVCRRGARVIAIDPRPMDLSFPLEHLIAAPWEIPERFSEIMNQGIAPSSHVSIVVGTRVLDFHGMREVLSSALLSDQARILPVVEGANSLGSACMDGGLTLFELQERIETGQIKALVVVEADPLSFGRISGRLGKAFSSLECLVVLDYLPSKVSEIATALLPTATIFEVGGCFVNHEGRLQEAMAVHRGGIPVSQTLAEGHPPRTLGAEVPGGIPGPSWEILRKLLGSMQEKMPLPGREALLSHAKEALLTGSTDLICQDRPESVKPPFSATGLFCAQKGQILVLPVSSVFGTEELSWYSSPAREAVEEPKAFLNLEDAQELGISSGDRIGVTLGEANLKFTAQIRADMAKGILLIEAHRAIQWWKMEEIPLSIGKHAIMRSS